MNINEIRFYITKTSAFEVVINAENGYDMPETAKELVDMITLIKNNPGKELAWSSDNCVSDEFTIDEYEIDEGE